jgi:hypothetical protein
MKSPVICPFKSSAALLIKDMLINRLSQIQPCESCWSVSNIKVACWHNKNKCMKFSAYVNIPVNFSGLVSTLIYLYSENCWQTRL